MVEMTLSELWAETDFIITKYFFLVEMLVLSNFWRNTIFPKWSQTKVIYFEMLILSELWSKTDFIIAITKNLLFGWNGENKVISKQSPLLWNVDTKRVMGKKRFYHRDQKKYFFFGWNVGIKQLLAEYDFSKMTS